MTKLCSACLLGVKCRYDGSDNLNIKVLQLAEREILLPVCPEQLGGFPTPREPTEIVDGKVISKTGQDLSSGYLKGAHEILKIAKLFGIKEAILKQRSPSCGCGKIYDGNFNGKIISGFGVTANLLLDNGIKVVSEEDL